MNTKTPTGGLKSFFPILDWLPHDKPEWLRFDMIAALSVRALLVPQGTAYSSIAGVPTQYGLYAALGSLPGYALFDTSGQVVAGPGAAIAAVAASVITLWATAGTNEWIACTAALAVTRPPTSWACQGFPGIPFSNSSSRRRSLEI